MFFVGLVDMIKTW